MTDDAAPDRLVYAPGAGLLVSARLEPDEGRPYWRKGFQTRIVDVMDIRVIRYWGMARKMAFELADGQAVLSPLGRGLKALIHGLLVANPAIEVYIGSIEWAQLESTDRGRWEVHRGVDRLLQWLTGPRGGCMVGLWH